MFWKKKQSMALNCVYHCLGKNCPIWVELNHQIKMEDGTIKDVPEGKCSIAWLPTLLVEIALALKQKK